MLWSNDVEAFINAYVNDLHQNSAAIFVGAGLSKAAGFVDWEGLLKPLATELGLNVSKEADLVGVAQYHVNKHFDNRHSLSQVLLHNFSDLPSPTGTHAILARLPVQTYWTTNYDRLLEKALEAQGRRVDSKYTTEQLHQTRPGRDVTVYKMHGDIEHPDHAILTRDDYERYYRSHEQFITALAGDLVSKTFLFLGFSFTDPNLNYVLSRVRIAAGKNGRAHYCIMKKRTQRADEEVADFQYDALRQELQIRDLARYQVRVLLVDDYPDITEILNVIEQRYRLKTVFISGSAVSYAPWEKDGVEFFLAKLAGALIRKGLRLSTGFGVGVGGAVVTGALEEIYKAKASNVDGRINMRPFPLTVEDHQRAETFQRYREELVSQAGTALFFFGNKEEGGNLVTADGVKAEFELANAKGLKVVPMGASGYISKELWTQVIADFDTFYPGAVPDVRRLFEQIGREVAEPMELYEPLLALVDLVTMGKGNG